MQHDRPAPGEIRLAEPRRRIEIVGRRDEAGNPMADLLRDELGIDAFPLDGDTRVLLSSWQDRKR